MFDINNELINLNLNKNIILFGQNSIYKNNLINNIKDGLTGKSKNILINGKKPDLKDYNIVYKLNSLQEHLVYILLQLPVALNKHERV